MFISAEQLLVRHCPQVDPQPEPVARVKLRQVNVMTFTVFLIPLLYNMLGTPFTVALTFVKSGLTTFSKFLAPAVSGLDEEKQDAFQRLPLRVDPDCFARF